MMALPGRRCGLRGNLIGKRYSMCPRSTNHNSASEVDEPYELCSSTRLTEVGRRGDDDEPHETDILIGREVGTIVCTIDRKGICYHYGDLHIRTFHVGIVEGGRVPTLGDAFTTGFCVDLSRMSFEFIAAALVGVADGSARRGGEGWGNMPQSVDYPSALLTS